MKKAFRVFLAAVLLCSGFIFSVPASAKSVSLRISAPSSARVGDTISVSAVLSDDSQLGTLTFSLRYDSAAVEILPAQCATGSLFNMNMPNWNASGAVKYTGISEGTVSAGGTVLTAVFRVKKANPQFSLALDSATDANDNAVSVSLGSAVTVGCAHNFGGWTVVQPSTCQQAGEQVRTCSDCGAKETAPLAMLSHTPGNWETTKQPTCTANGQREQHCTVCGGLVRKESIAALGHNFQNWKTETEPTCTEPGTRTATCARCGKTETQSVAALGHNVQNWKTEKEPTCTESGTRVGTCTRCGKTETQSIAALGHDIQNWKTEKEPTCTENGTRVGACTRCGKTVTESVPALGHSISAGQETKAPTCTEAGERTGICTRCGKQATEAIPSLGHEFGEWVLVREPSETDLGLEQRTCTRCGAVEERTPQESETTTANAELPVSAGVEEPPQSAPSRRNWIVIAVCAGVGALALLGGIGVLVYTQKQKKKSRADW